MQPLPLLSILSVLLTQERRAGSRRCEQHRHIISPRRQLALALYALCLCVVLLAGAIIPSGSGVPDSPQSALVDQAGGGKDAAESHLKVFQVEGGI